MSDVDQLVNSCLMPEFGGAVVPEWIATALENGLAGICVHGRNLAGAEQSEMAADRVRDSSAAVRAVQPDALAALDEEGGDVTRLDYRIGSRSPGNLALGTVDDEALTKAVATAIGRDLRRSGATGRVAALRERLTERAAVTPESDDSVGGRAARAALRPRGVTRLGAAPVVVELRAGTNMAVGGAKWSLAGPLAAQRPPSGVVTVTAAGPSAGEGVARADGAPLVVAVPDAYRSHWQRSWLQQLIDQRPDPVVLALGMRADLDLVPGPAVAARGAARANTRAVADLFAGRERA